MITFEQYMSEASNNRSGECWISSYGRISVIYNNEKTYITNAIFDFYSKIYDGTVRRSCGNIRCVNPEHLMNRVESFWSNVDVTSDVSSCWEWKSKKGTNDYAETRHNGISVMSHRMAYELFYKIKIPDGLFACHKCDNPPCCNPRHIFLGTRQDNTDDRELKGRNKIPRLCGESHGQHKLLETDIVEIRSLYKTGAYSYALLSKIYKVSFGQIRNIVKRKQWAWLV